MQERRNMLYADTNTSYLAAGLIKAVKELSRQSTEACMDIVASWEEEQLPVENIYFWLVSQLDSKLLIDKTPRYSRDIETLRELEDVIEEPKFIHLVRHPYATIESAVRQRFRSSSVMSPYEIAENQWLLDNKNNLAFLDTIDSSRKYLVRYEELVKEPDQVLRAISGFLEVPFEKSVLDLYQGHRITDGIDNSGRMGGSDTNCYKFDGVDSSRAEAWREARLPQPLRDTVQDMAEQLGYSLTWPLKAIRTET